MFRILLIDDEANILSVLSTLLKAEGYDVVAVREGEKAKEFIENENFDLMVCDIRMTPISGMDLLKVARKFKPESAVIMLTAYATVETAIQAMKLGAFDYVTKPFKVDELLITIQRALEYKKAISENVDLKAQITTKYRFENIVCESPLMKDVCEMIERVARTDTTILISGESGTSKELVAKAVHAHSARKNKRFLAVNCAALPEALLESEMFGHVKGAFTGAMTDKKGLFEAVEGGTIFLDEIGAMPLGIQGKLLRVLQEKEIRKVGGNENISVNARVLAATNTPLEELIKQGKFREDLYYRLNVIPIHINPLRERREDIIPLIHHVLRTELGEGRSVPKISPKVYQILENYDWPGNVRELENAVKHAMAFSHGEEITPEVLPPKILASSPEVTESNRSESPHQFESLKAFLRSKEKDYMKQVLSYVNGDKERAANSLKISLATLYRKLPKNMGGESDDDEDIDTGGEEETTSSNDNSLISSNNSE